MLKPTVDRALESGCECVEKVCIVERNGKDINFIEGRDYLYNKLIKPQSPKSEPEVMDSEEPLYYHYIQVESTGQTKRRSNTSSCWNIFCGLTIDLIGTSGLLSRNTCQRKGFDTLTWVDKQTWASFRAPGISTGATHSIIINVLMRPHTEDSE